PATLAVAVGPTEPRSPAARCLLGCRRRPIPRLGVFRESRPRRRNRGLAGARCARRAAVELRPYPFFLALTAAVSAGTILSASPTTPRSAIFMIGASASLLMAMMTFEVFMPTVCCIAPEIPTAMYTPGRTDLPVWPTCIEYGTHPAPTTAPLAP